MELTDARRWHRPGVAGRERFGGSFKLKLKLVSLICNACILARKFVMYAYLHASLSLNHACITIKLTKFKFKFETAGETLIAARRGCAREASAAARRTGGMKGLAVLVLALHASDAQRTPGEVARFGFPYQSCKAGGIASAACRRHRRARPPGDHSRWRSQWRSLGTRRKRSKEMHIKTPAALSSSMHVRVYRSILLWAYSVARVGSRVKANEGKTLP